MKRTVWLALGFLIVVGALAALKFKIATPAKEQAAFADTDVSYVDEAPDKKVVRLIPIALPTTAPPGPREKVTKIISRHWHEGYAKVTKRFARNRRVASTAKK
jgi:hypothetical protein